MSMFSSGAEEGILMFSKKFFIAGVGIAVLGLVVSIAPPALMAGATGVDEVTSPVRYGSDGRVIGSIVEDIQNSDDASQLMTAPWKMNFFGSPYDGLCVTSNGTISPVVHASARCSNVYDTTMAGLASAVRSPVIAVFANDNHLGNPVRNAQAQVVSVVVTGDPSTSDSVVTVTTSTAHGLTTGDVRSLYVISPLFANGNTADSRTDEYWYNDVAVTVFNATTFTVAGDRARGYSGDYAPTYPAGVKAAPVTIDSGWVWQSSSANQNAVDDGVGAVNTVYTGETMIDGRDAWVYTNYRSVTYEDRNPQVLTNTFQIVLIKKPTVNGDVKGFDFDIEYNYGSVRDGGDGYAATGQSCRYMNSGCRTGVGLVDWDPDRGIADVYELFGATPSRDLVDGHTTSMTSNRLNSTIDGRYTFAMVGGSVQNFQVPVMDGTGTTAARPSPTDPVPAQAGLALGHSAMLTNGVPSSTVTVAANSGKNGVVITDGAYVLNLAGVYGSGANLQLDESDNLIVQKSGFVSTSGQGFAPNTVVEVWAFSAPLYVGPVNTDDSGSFRASLQLPPGLAVGVHNLQVIGYDSSGRVRVMTLAIVVRDDGSVVAQLPNTGVNGADTALVAGAAVLFALMGARLVLAYRRRPSWRSWYRRQR
jgi:LPXTG-motif cell wall-anchored protein